MAMPEDSTYPDSPRNTLRVLIVSDSPVIRAGISALLSASPPPPVEIVEYTDDYQDGSPLHELFDAAILASNPSDDSFTEDLALASELAGGVVVLTTELPEAAAPLLADPPHGWAILPLDSPTPVLAAALAATASGLVVLSQELTDLLHPDEPPGTPTDPSPLTPRELEVLNLVSDGLPNKSIARTLAISDHTVKFHISSIYAKLDAANRAEAVSLAARLGLIVL